ncbi:MAG: cytochrome c [Terracidiphilus sp.]|jgi:mono/diheme cytochrome c family protein
MVRRRGGWVRVIAGITASLSIAQAGCNSAPSLNLQEAEGKQLYEGRCAHCHRDNDMELKKVPPDLHGIFNHRTLPSGAPATDAAVRQNVLAGKGMMPAFAGRFNEEQMAALLAYLHTGLR